MLTPSHLTGGASELKAATYYLELGYQVYFPIVQQGKVDLIIEDFTNKTLARVQVKTAYWNVFGSHEYLQCRTRTVNKYQTLPIDMNYDILVIIFGDELWVIPASVVTSSNITLRDRVRGRVDWDQYKIIRKTNEHRSNKQLRMRSSRIRTECM